MENIHTLWTPDKEFIRQSNLTKYTVWLKDKTGKEFGDYHSLWRWSIENPADFWESISDYFKVKFYARPQHIRSDDKMPHTKWFEGATLNYAEHVFLQRNNSRPAIIFTSENQKPKKISWQELEDRTSILQTYLKHSGIKKGARVVAYLPNIPEATISLLATTSLGAIWSSCSPDFGAESVLDRFKQIQPQVLIAVDGYRYNGKPYDRMRELRDICRKLPSLKKIILIPYLNENPNVDGIKNLVLWDEVMQTPKRPITFAPVSFSHPIWILYSSGTTGIPKAITHSHGGMLLEHLKYLSFHNDVHEGENFFWYSTTGWMMWNFVQASLLVGATIVLYDGAAGYDGLSCLWRLAAELPIHHFGTSAPFIIACMKSALYPNEKFDLSALRSIGSTGSPLPPEAFDYVYQKIKKDVWLCSMSGGTDICTAWVGGNPWKPVIEGEIQCRTLGCSMFALDEKGEKVQDEVGEMVITEPMPCMPVYFWNDKDYTRYTSSYFEMFPELWRHGDWIRITPNDGIVIYGRSDTTLNRHGVRIGTAEIYRSVNKMQSIKDSLIVNLELPEGGDYMPLFVTMKDGKELDSELKKEIKLQLRNDYSPRHVPDAIIQVPDIPYTISGKKMEAPVKRILMGGNVEKAANKGAMRNPDSLEFFIRLSEENGLNQ